MTVFDRALTRCPCAGVSIHSYDNNFRGNACKIVNTLARVALLIIATLLIVNRLPTTYMIPVVSSLAGCVLLSFVLGSNSERKGKEFFLEMAIASVCVAMVFLAQGRSLTWSQAGIGVLGTIGSGLIIGSVAEKGHVGEVDIYDSKPINGHLSPKNTSVPFFDYFIGIARDLSLSAISMVSGLFGRDKYSREINTKESAALCVLVHGLASRPSVLDDFHKSISALYPNVTIFQPYVYKNGQCSLNEAKAPIERQILNWADKNPYKPIIMIGHSNGARIVGTMAAGLEVANSLYVHCVGGPFYGSKFINRPTWPQCFRNTWCRLFKWLYSEEAFTEMSYSSDFAKQTTSCLEHVSNDNLHYYFYATPSDALVFPYGSAFPKVPKAKYYIADGEGHQGDLSAFHGTIMRQITSVL